MTTTQHVKPKSIESEAVFGGEASSADQIRRKQLVEANDKLEKKRKRMNADIDEQISSNMSELKKLNG